MLSELDWLGASIPGPKHLEDGEATEDAWLCRRGSGGRVLVVCDGLGSREHSRIGARQACEAVREAARIWTGQDAPVEGLLTLIHATWRVKIHPHAPSDCATTCLFGVVEPSGRTTVGQLGDGLMALRRDGELIEISDETDTFADETIGLGLGAGISNWTHDTWTSFPPESALLLATDGVAGDLVPDSAGDVIEDLLERYDDRDRGERWMQLSRELFDWVRPGHVDDKTIAMLWRQRSTS